MIEAYQEGLKNLKEVMCACNEKFNEAEVHPQSDVAPRAALMAAYSYYSQSYYGVSIAELDRFLGLPKSQRYILRRIFTWFMLL